MVACGVEDREAVIVPLLVEGACFLFIFPLINFSSFSFAFL